MMTEDRFARFEERFERFVEYVESRFQDTEGRLRELPTREEWSQFATKADLAQFATKAELTGEIGALRAEMRERFENVHDRLVALEKGQADLRWSKNSLAEVRVSCRDLWKRNDCNNSRNLSSMDSPRSTAGLKVSSGFRTSKDGWPSWRNADVSAMLRWSALFYEWKLAWLGTGRRHGSAGCVSSRSWPT